ncbi:ribose 5-phosphate isomerase B [Govanella unica]|uniref:Ribose 5-phosphate isomerase B n=1 Tax=Govanella unica TaxID=2975056 RepID=A0A9X3TYF5_9PROT|nr:ribose 5-phosphate isomerase B [Govania unica]MDA5194083.1 ribose 5-phosphate isomerase B [Govania unica]
MSKKPVAIASDHGGFEMKSLLIEELMRLGLDALDLGCHGPESVDYPDYADRMAEALKSGKADRGILLCGSGIGISMAANRHAHVRAALCHDHYSARMSRQHNDANVLVLGGRTTGPEIAKDCLKIFLETEFEGGRHAGRVAKFSPAEDAKA